MPQSHSSISTTPDMKKLYIIGLMGLLSLAACQNRPTEKEDATISQDSTRYGVCVDDFGMSTFAVRTTEGDTLELMRTSEAGVDAKIYGDVVPGHEYAFTTTDSLQSLSRAINLSQLKSFTSDFKIANGQLVFTQGTQADTVEVIWLDADSLVAKGREHYKLLPLSSR